MLSEVRRIHKHPMYGWGIKNANPSTGGSYYGSLPGLIQVMLQKRLRKLVGPCICMIIGHTWNSRYCEICKRS